MRDLVGPCGWSRPATDTWGLLIEKSLPYAFSGPDGERFVTSRPTQRLGRAMYEGSPMTGQGCAPPWMVRRLAFAASSRSDR